MEPNILLHDGETILIRTQPQAKVVWYWLVSRAFRWLLLIIIFGWAFVINGANLFRGVLSSALAPHFEVFAILLLLILFGVIYFWLDNLRKKHWYFVTSERCINFSGFLGINKQIIQFNNIVDVNIRQNVLENMLGISAVILDAPGISYSGRGRGTIAIVGLSPEEAENIAHVISDKMRKQAKN